MDLPTFAVSVIALLGAMVGLLVYFSKKQFDKIESAFTQSSNTMIRMDMLEKQVSVVQQMAQDIAVLKFAIVGELARDKKKRKIDPDDDYD